MNKTTLTLILSTILSCSAIAKDVVDTKIHLSCASPEFNAEGKKVNSGATEEIDIDIKRINWNDKEPNKPPAWGSMSNIKIRSGDKTYDGALLRSTRDEVAFSFANDVIENGNGKTLAFVYEFSLPKAELKRTMLTLFGTKSTSISTAVSKCKKS
jgi:hypothetical protein